MLDDFESATRAAMAKAIYERRHEKKWTTLELANRAEVNTGTVSRTENSVTQLTLETATRLCTALDLHLWDLVASVPSIRRIDPVTSSGSLITQENIAMLLKINSSSQAQCANLLAKWLGEVTDVAYPSDKPLVSRQLFAELVTLLPYAHPVLQLRIQYPAGHEYGTILSIHAFGGSLRNDDFERLVGCIAAAPEQYRKLDRQERDVLRRLQSDTPDRVRVADLIKLSETLEVDLVGVYANVKGVLGRPPYRDLNSEDSTTRSLIATFVIIAAWLRTLYERDAQWIHIIRKDLEDSATHEPETSNP